tara:strand:- start:7259 stop:7639 length:381 start_codon:yes stop_codon:yes gene_type:complete
MATKEDLVNNIKAWMRVEEEIKTLSRELKVRRQERKGYADALVGIMKSNEIDCFDLSEGKLMYAKNKVKPALSKRHLMTCLEQYAKANPEAGVDPAEMGQFILDSREVKVKEGVRHRPHKKSVDNE